MAKKLINKKSTKKIYGKCVVCGLENYCCLHVHRIVEGKNKGKYTQNNSLVLCAVCHCRCHAGEIVIDRKYQTTTGKWVLHLWENNEEKWISLDFG